MRIGRPIPPLALTDDERETLERWARRPTTAQALAQRARVILACAADETNTRVARHLRLTKQTVGNGAAGSSPSGWTGCSMTRAQARRARSAMREWKTS